MDIQEFHSRYKFSPPDKIGEGAFGRVFKALDTINTNHIAIKKSQAKEINGKVYSLVDEVDTLKELPPHKNIANYQNVYSFVEGGENVDYLLMQFYPEGNLSQLLKSRLSESQKLNLLKGILEGINHLHKNGIIHRDIKPSNILISKIGDEYIPKITDFGISKRINEGETSLTNTFGGGTLNYSSPEQLKGETVRYNSDLWSVGIIAHQIFSGSIPFDIEKSLTESARQLTLHNSIINGEIKINRDAIPTVVQKIINETLVIDASARTSNSTSLLQILESGQQKDHSKKSPSNKKINQYKKSSKQSRLVISRFFAYVIDVVLVSIILILGFYLVGGKQFVFKLLAPLGYYHKSVRFFTGLHEFYKFLILLSTVGLLKDILFW